MDTMIWSASEKTERVVAAGPRVVIRTLAAEDIPFILDCAGSEFLDEMVGSEFLDIFRIGCGDTRNVLKRLTNDAGQLNLAVFEYGSDRPVGLVRLFNIHLSAGYAFVETMIADERARRLGFGVEATKLLCYYAMDVLGLRRFETKVYGYNRLCINALKRRGWTHEGTLRQAAFHDGGYEDILIFGILRDEILVERLKEPWTPLYPQVAL